jgi:hypothetical protein
MYSETDLAWTAGIMDGDGCISMKGNSGPFKAPIVVIDNTDLEILDYLILLYGGGLTKKKVYSDKHRQAWSWRIYGSQKVIAFLSAILPYMKCQAKRERASVIVNQWPKVNRRNGCYSEDQKRAKLDLESLIMSIGPNRGSGGARLKLAEG